MKKQNKYTPNAGGFHIAGFTWGGIAKTLSAFRVLVALFFILRKFDDSMAFMIKSNDSFYSLTQKLAIIFLVSFLGITGQIKAQDAEGIYFYSNGQYNEVGVLPLSGGNYLATSFTNSSQDNKLVLLNGSGIVLSTHIFPTGQFIRSMIQHSNGSIIIGTSNSSNIAFVHSLNPSLTSVNWSKTVNSSGSGSSWVKELANGDILASDANALSRINASSGASIWSGKNFGDGTPLGRIYFHDFVELSTGELVAVGQRSGYQFTFSRFNGVTGAWLSSKYYNFPTPDGSTNLNGCRITLGADGNLYILGELTISFQKVLIKMDPTGTVAWAKEFRPLSNGPFHVNEFNIIPSIDGNGVTILAYFRPSGGLAPAIAPLVGITLFKVDYSGNIQWGKVYGTNSGSFVSRYIRTALGGYVFGGVAAIDGANNGQSIIRTDANGDIAGCDRDVSTSFVSFALTTTETNSSFISSFPNTFSDFTLNLTSGSSIVLGSRCPTFPPENCTNGIDDDGDGLVDCDDPDCGVISADGLHFKGGFKMPNSAALNGNIIQLSDDNYAVIRENVLVKFDNLGTVVQSKTLTSFFDFPTGQSAALTAYPYQGGFYLVERYSNGSSTLDWKVINFDNNFNILWSKAMTYNGCINSHFRDANVLSNGNLIYAHANYETCLGGTQNASIGIVILDKGTGNMSQSTFQIPGTQEAGIGGVLSLAIGTNDEKYMIVPVSSTDMYIVKLDNNNQLVWLKRISGSYPSTSNTFYTNTQLDLNGDLWLYLLGNIYKISGTTGQIMFVKSSTVPSAFQAQTKLSFDGSNIYIVETTYGLYGNTPIGDGASFVTKIDLNGTILWQKVLHFYGPTYPSTYSFGVGYLGSYGLNGAISNSGGVIIFGRTGTGMAISSSGEITSSCITPFTASNYGLTNQPLPIAIDVLSISNFYNHSISNSDLGASVSNNTFSWAATCLTKIEVCTNTLDDDGDGLIDSVDPDCACALATCDKIPNVAYVLSVDEVDPMANNNRGNADLKLGSCTCDLNPIAYDVQCNNNGTPNNPADDTYTITNFIVTAAAGGGADGYNLSGGITASGNAYGTAYSYGPFPISGGPLSVTVTDVNTTSCTRTDQIIPPLTCSNCMVTGTATGDIVCEGESIYLMSSGGDMYSWSGPNGFTSTLQSPVIPNATLAMGGTYTVVVTNTTGGGCTDTKTATVTVNAAPLVTLGADIQTCLDDVTTLTATGCSGALLWNTGESSNTISVSPSQTSAYSVQCTASGCVGKDTIIVYVSDITVKGTPTACKPNSSTHDVSVVVTLVNPPVSGTLTMTIGGMSQVFNAPFTSPITHNFIDLASDGQYHTIQATLSNGASCSESQFYLAPSPCTTCDITSMTATPGTCNPLTNQYILTGTISTSNPPSSGNLIISTNGVATTIPGPFSATINYEITGLVSDGMSHDVTAYFTDDLSCVFSTNYLSPVPCNSITCDISLTRTVGTCDVNNNLYSLQGMVTFTGAPETGTLVVVVEGEGSLTYLPPFVSPISYNFPNLTSDGGTKNVTAYFTGNGACFDEVSYTAPARCGNFNCNIRLSMEVGVCDPNTNTYAVTGEVYINNPPSGGNIIISYPGGQQTVANTGVSPVSFQIPGLPASGGIGEIGVTMSNDLPCYTRSIYEIPESCGMISLCSISATASASPCDPERNDYTLTGTLTFSNAPASNIILEIDGITHTIAGPVSSPLMYEIPGMPSDGSDHQLLVYFENNANCSNSVTYTAPAVCAPNTCTMSMNLVTGTCQSATNTFSVSGSLTVSNAPASGQLRIWIEGTGFETVINAPFGANIPFSFSNMVSTGLPYDIKASFSADLSCQVRRSFVAPDACLSGGGCEVQVLAAAACTSGATFTVTGMVLIQNAPSSGTMTIRVGTLLQTLSAPFDPMAFIGFSGFPLGTDVPGEITFSADPSCSVITMVAAPQDCNCEVSLGTVSGLCVEGTETHNARGTVTLVNPPLTGTLTISVPGGQSEVFTAPFNSPLYYEVTGLPDGGGSRTVTAAFSADAGCTATQSYTAPLDCPICDIQLPVVQSLSCYNNDTPSKITDNKIRIRLLVTNANPALTTYNLTVNGGTTISPAVGLYGVGTEFTMGPGTAGGGATFIITITDSSGLTCNTAEVTVPDPGNCNNTTECPTIKCGSVIIQVNGN